MLPGEAHDNERQSSHAIKGPLSKAEVVDQCVNIGWDDVKNGQNTLKGREKFQILEFCVSTYWVSCVLLLQMTIKYQLHIYIKLNIEESTCIMWLYSM